MRNFQKVRSLQGGYSTDLTNNIERDNTYQKAIAGRLYSKDGVLSFSGGKGTDLVYTNNRIVKYLAYESFEDSFLVFAKCLKNVDGDGDTQTEEVCNKVLTASLIDLIGSSTNNSPLNVSTEITDSSSALEDCYDVVTPVKDPTDFKTNYTCDESSSQEINFAEYYKENPIIPNSMVCQLDSDVIPINNKDYDDCLILMHLDSDYNLVGNLLWQGKQNWPVDGKIDTVGIEENEFYKRVYYSDAVNPRRVVNIKDTSLRFRNAEEFNQVLNNVLLQPEIKEVKSGGQLKSMKVLYVYRSISENGQLSEFSPSSFFVDILPENESIKFRGGETSELTNKSVTVQCNIINPEPSSEIECIALEFEAQGPPTAIRNLGRKSATSVVEFNHFGSESEFDDNITYSDILEFKNTWKYCNALGTKKNKLIAGGLRNEPLPTEIDNLEYLFPLHSWKSDGSTHDCLMNPSPWEYRYIDPTNTDPLIYIKQKVYRSISSFGPLTISFKNKATNELISKTFTDLGIQSYTNITSEVIAWLFEEESNNADWLTFFPNLKIEDIGGQLLLSPIDSLLQTDMSQYVFESDNNQYIENFDNDVVFLESTIDQSKLIHGAQSIGFNDGVGVRVTYREFKEPLLNQATSVYDGTGKILDYHTPSMEKYCMKGEIYRVAFQSFDNDSTRLFAIPLGDLMIPNIGDVKSFIDDTGNAIITSEQYTNQSVENGILYGHGVKMHIEVRLSCELQKLIPMYQMVYVERTEEDRTIICQGISAPLNRVQDSGSSEHRMPDAVRNKWTLPYYGGPVYEKKGFENYDSYGENDQYTEEGQERRTMAHRGLMYFDSPDLYYGKVSDQFIETSLLDVRAKLNTDHTAEVIMERGGLTTSTQMGNEIYPKFSRKLLEPQVEGDNNSDDLPHYDLDTKESGTHDTHFVNISVYANYRNHTQQLGIQKAVNMLQGEVVSGVALDVDNDISNNAFGLSSMPWYFGSYQRKWSFQDGRPNSNVFKGAMTSPGYSTVFIKTDEDLFTDDFIGNPLPNIDTQIRLGGDDYTSTYDTIPLVNIFRNNRESVYGGRSTEAYSKNTYIPLSKTIPTLKSSNNAQVFDCGADVYITLNIRNKNAFGDDEVKFIDYNNSGGARDTGDIPTHTRNAAWCYAVVLESQIEPKLNSSYEFYRQSGSSNFSSLRKEQLNESYLNENNLRSYIPKPYKFKDDPNQGNVIAVSDVKLAGDYFDAWTVFKPNNFYALLEKNKGDVTNFVRQDEELFCIQEQQTSLIYIGTDRILTDQQGAPINIQQGSGTVVDGHKVISDYGTAIRRSVVESDYGFSFFDEKKIEFVKIKEPLLAKNFLHLEYFERFKNDKIIDTESYFDQENKETCIRIRTEKGNNFMLSYNEVLGKFNGEFPIQYDKDLFIMFDEKVYAPIRSNGISSDLHQLNKGDILNFFGEQTSMVLGLYVNADADKVFQYKVFGAVTNLDYPLTSIFAKSNLGYDRVVSNTHDWYKIREGVHTVPMINDTDDINQATDIRGNWVYVEVTAESLNKNKVDILAIINYLRYSHL